MRNVTTKRDEYIPIWWIEFYAKRSNWEEYDMLSMMVWAWRMGQVKMPSIRDVLEISKMLWEE